MRLKITWGKGLILFFIVFFVWIFSFVFFAMRQNIDLVSEDYYQKGADYSRQITIDQRSAPYQDSVQVGVQGDRVAIELSKTAAAEGDSVEAYFFRPSDKTKDLRLNLKKTAAPILVDKNQFSHGRYLVYISWGKTSEKRTVKKTLDIE